MPYKGDAERILSGSVNLLQPGSEIPDYDAQKITNFTYDANSNLRSRKGSETVCSASGVSQMLKALGSRWQAVNLARITAYQGYVWKVGAGQAQKNCATIISQGGPRKSKGTQDWRWIPEAPTTKPTVKAASVASLLIDDFSDGWTVLPAGYDSYTDDGQLQINNTVGDETFSATKEVSLDLETGHHIDDVHKITLWCKQWKKVEGVSFEVDVNAGDFTTDSYLSKMELVNKIIGKRDEAVFYIRKRPLGVDKYAQDKKRYGHFSRIGSTPEKGWKTVTKLRIKIDFSDTTKFRFIKWELVGDEDNVLEGDDFQVFYTYTTDDGHESNPSPPSDPVTVNRSGIEVSDMADSADPQVTKKHVYLTGGTLGAIYRVNGSGEDDEANAQGITGSSYDIIQGEDDITALGIEMENDHDDPPNGNVICGPYYDRILIAQDGDHPERLWWSKQAKPYAFPGADQAIGNWNDVGTAGEKIMAITTRPHAALIYKENSVWVLSGDPGDLTGDFHNSNAQMGISSPNGVVQAGPIDYAHMSEGIYAFNGSTPTKISQKIDPIFKGRSVVLSDGSVAQPLSDVTTTALGFRDNVLWFSYDGNQTVKLDVESGRWFSDSRGFTAFFYEGQNGTFVGARTNGQVVSLERGTTDDGNPIDLDYLSKDYDMGRPDLDKRFEDFTLETSGDPLVLTAYFNGRQPDAYSAVLGVTSGGREVFKCNANPSSSGQRARTMAIGLTGQASSETVVNKLIFNWYDEAREAKSYDTEVSDAGTHKVKLIRELMPSLENETDVTFSLLTDLPGFGLAQREFFNVAPNTLRRTEPLVVLQEHYAHDFQVIGSGGSGTFHLFGLRALVQVIGTYLHGTKSEYYLSDPMDFGTERVKLLKEIEIIYSTTGNVYYTLSTDLPGGIITARKIDALPPTSGEESFKIRIDGYTKGRLYQLKLQPTQDCRVEAIRFWMKFIGEREATPWHWVDLPLEKTQDAIWVPLAFGKDQAA